jgi:hypothetical protein
MIMAFASSRRMFRHVLIEGVSFFSDQNHLRLHCRVNVNGKPVSTGLHADYSVFNALLQQLNTSDRTALSALIGEALLSGGKRWNFLDLNRALGKPCTVRRCLVESALSPQEKNNNNPMKIRALQI